MALIDRFFDDMLKTGASDLHLEQGEPPRVRQHGHLLPIEGEALLEGSTLNQMLSEICPKTMWKSFGDRGDADFAYELGDRARFRANYFRHFNGLGAIFRIIPSKILSLEQLKSPEVFKSFAHMRSGLVLVTGPTGSGKSTTLAAIIDHINATQTLKIVTIEEPVEFVHQSKKSKVIHREVGPDTKSFTTGLQGALKSDANVILVGEMRDQETIELALTAVEMGILVFGTLHTNSAAKTIDRIIDVFPAKKKAQIRSILANSLKGVVSQQLVRTADGNGRVAAQEILLATTSLPSIIRSGETIKLTTVMQTGSQQGMITMDDCLQRFLNQGVISKEDAYLKALDKSLFQMEQG